MLVLYASVALAAVSTPDEPAPETIPEGQYPECIVTQAECQSDVQNQISECLANASAESAAQGKPCTAVYLTPLCVADAGGCSSLQTLKCVLDCAADLTFPFTSFQDAKDWYETWSDQ